MLLRKFFNNLIMSFLKPLNGFWLAVFVLFAININAYPLIDPFSEKKRLELEMLENCGLNISNFYSFPRHYSSIYTQLKSYENNDITKDCEFLINKFLADIETVLNKSIASIGFSSKYKDYYIKDFGSRYYPESIGYINFYGNKKNIFYNINVQSNKNGDANYDESFISFYTDNNKIITFGKQSRFWSPSWDTSLILSHSSRPVSSISLKNNIPQKVDLPLIRYLGQLEYEYFIAKLEKNRAVKNPYLGGMRGSFYFSDSFQFSLFRTFIFGGEGRDISFDTLINLLIGRDNVNSNGIDKENEPGNQLAGADLKYIFGNKEFFLQIVGEDEAGYLPSRTINTLGFSLNNILKTNSKLIFESTDTFSSSGIKNYTYSHYLYKSGYRHKGMPIGASIDADSKRYSISYLWNISNNEFFKLKISNSEINLNGNSANAISKNFLKLNGIQLKYEKEYGKKYFLGLSLVLEQNNFDKNDIIYPMISFRRFLNNGD